MTGQERAVPLDHGGVERARCPRALVLALSLAAACAAVPDAARPDPRHELTAEELRGLQPVRAGRTLLPRSWPGGAKVAVALTFDVDAELVWLGKYGPVSPTTLTRGEFGVRRGLVRVLELLDRHELPATFFLPALIVERYPEAVAAIRDRDRHEIGCHGYAHEAIGTLTAEQERAAMEHGLGIFRRAGLEPRGHRSAGWHYTEHTLPMLVENGMLYDSSLMADDHPYELLDGRAPTGIVELPVHWLLDDWPYFELEWDVPWSGQRDVEEVYRIWLGEFEGAREEGGVLVLTLHPQVIGRHHRMRMLGRLVGEMLARGDVWFATMGEIAEWLGWGR